MCGRINFDFFSDPNPIIIQTFDVQRLHIQRLNLLNYNQKNNLSNISYYYNLFKIFSLLYTTTYLAPTFPILLHVSLLLLNCQPNIEFF